MLEPRVDLKRLEDRIERFEQGPVVKNMIMFYGDSAFTRWKTEKYGNPNLEDEIRMRDGGQAVVNHGFGTSTAEEELYFYPRAVRPWEPRALVLLSAANDRGQGYSAMEIMALQARIFEYARADFPGIRLFLCNNRPFDKTKDSPLYVRNNILEYNDLVAQYCATHDDTTLIDHNKYPELFIDGKVDPLYGARPEMFIEDRVHYNAMGYGIYKKLFTDALANLL